MTQLTVAIEKQVPVKYLKADLDVRYWEDAAVNGVDESDDNPKMPFYSAKGWTITIDLETGRILDWPEGVCASTHYKVCDGGVYSLLNEVHETVIIRDWYVPDMLSPGGEEDGDYVILNIDKSGLIHNWNADLSFFEKED